MILEMCSTYYDASGSMRDLGHFERTTFEQIIQGMAASSLRCIAFAHNQLPEEEHEIREATQKLKEDSSTLIGLVGIKDPCRPGVRKSVEDCQHAGVNVKMITGDNIFTARAIATECGILRPDQDMNNEAVVEGEVFRQYTPDERIEKVDKIRVMARSSSFDKLLMVQCLKQKGHVVAVTGDGTNDAPALKEADIGLSMGIQGTEVAKESSDIIILDDNFASVATVLRWGRCVYNNIQKFIQFQLTVNVAALVINFVAAVSAGALALATEQPTKELMEKPPMGRTEPLISNIMWRNLLAQALYQIVVLLTLQFKGESIFGVSKKVKDTLIFNTFVLCQVFNEFNARELEKKTIFKGLHKNKLFLGIIGITIILQVVMVEFLKKFADTERLDWGQWGACIGIAAASWPIGWVVKCIPVSDKPFISYLKW
ncbi:putative calcium-transporting ATPase 13, plasma membrane-type [Vitis vinifera]|uniref:P-type Ca(2+) transporter n=1 Tax=Vitis vinifera TaxID=29760 RepID=A0A438CIH2_VITVI|nr:putative calcium-transporting ATPase 13, plasma membrane-type [Vitis vinifera]